MGKEGGGMKGKFKIREETLAYQGTTDPVKSNAQKNRTLLFLSAAMICDISFSIVLYVALHWGHLKDNLHISVLLKSLLRFRYDCEDLILLSFLRCIILSLITKAATGYAFKEGTELGLSKEGRIPNVSDSNKLFKSKSLSLTRHHDDNESLNQPLLEKEMVKKKLDENEVDLGFREWLSNLSKKDLTLGLSFIICTFFQIYIGAKCVCFKFTHEAIQGSLMGSAVLWINAQSLLIGSLTERFGVYGKAKAITESKATSQNSGFGMDLTETRPVSSIQLLEINTSPNGGMRNKVGVSEEGGLRGDRGMREEKVIDPKTYLFRAIALAKNELPIICIGFFCLFMTTVASLVLPNYQGRILDDVIMMNPAMFHEDVMLMVGFSIASGIFGSLRGLCFSVVGKRVLKTLQDKLFKGVVIQDVAYFDATTSGELTSRLTNDVSAMAEPINYQLSLLVRNFILLLGGVLLCFYTSWKLSMLAFTTMAPILHITATYSRWSRELNRKRSAVLAEANSAASEALGNIRTVRAFSTEEIEIKKYETKTHKAMAKGVRDAFAYSGALAINNWLDLGASVLILWYGGVLVMEGRMSIGKLITFQLYWNLIQNGYSNIMSVLMSLTRASGSAQRVLTLVDALPDIDPNAGIKVETLNGDITLDNVHFHYQMRPDHAILKGVNLEVARGKVCALVGRSGGGKSTIIHLLMRFYDPVNGRILLDGFDLRDLNLKSVHLHMGLVSQESQMWASSIEDNITYGLESYTKEEMMDAANSIVHHHPLSILFIFEAFFRYANAHDFIMKFPEGYATRVGERGVRLSGGQRQRVAIARMLLRRPKILLLDEATSSLDTESEAQVQKALDRLIQEGGRTIVLVAHRLSTVRNADVIAVMDNGCIVERGRHDDLINISNGVYEKLVRRQITKAANVINEDDIDSLIENS